MLTVMTLLVVAAFICAIAEALGKCPSWVPQILICVVLALMVLPKG
jgi:hypothetical protein